jgi:hypothetical protein
MSIRERVEEALTKHLLEKQGLTVHFLFGDPIVQWRDDVPEEAQRFMAGPNDYYDAQEQAEQLYALMMKTIDFNRLALESVGAWMALTDNDRYREFGMNAKETGQAIRLALTTEKTFPDWDAEIAAENKKVT